VDNWKYAPAAKTWARLRDLPTSGSVFGGAGGGDSTFEDRYVLLLGAYQYDQVYTSVRQSGGGGGSSNLTAAAYGVVTHAAAQPHFATGPIAPEPGPEKYKTQGQAGHCPHQLPQRPAQIVMTSGTCSAGSASFLYEIPPEPRPTCPSHHQTTHEEIVAQRLPLQACDEKTR
jgi:hypothetical protein